MGRPSLRALWHEWCAFRRARRLLARVRRLSDRGSTAEAAKLMPAAEAATARAYALRALRETP